MEARLERVIGLMERYLEYKGADLRRVKPYGWRGMCCPFHDDRHASARVNLELGGFRCLACDVSGDALKLIQKQEHLESRESAESWAEQSFGESYKEVPKAAKRGKAKGRSSWRYSVSG